MEQTLDCAVETLEQDEIFNIDVFAYEFKSEDYYGSSEIKVNSDQHDIYFPGDSLTRSKNFDLEARANVLVTNHLLNMYGDDFIHDFTVKHKGKVQGVRANYLDEVFGTQENMVDYAVRKAAGKMRELLGFGLTNFKTYRKKILSHAEENGYL